MLPLSLAMDKGEFNNGGGSGGGGGGSGPAAAAAAAVAVTVVDIRDSIQWKWWQRYLMAVTALVARFNGNGRG
jgi:hypothetical protein